MRRHPSLFKSNRSGWLSAGSDTQCRGVLEPPTPSSWLNQATTYARAKASCAGRIAWSGVTATLCAHGGACWFTWPLPLRGCHVIPTAIAQAGRDDPLPLPDKAKLEAGDFLFPKEPGKYVPYHQGSDRTFDDERIDWERERLAMIASLSARPPDAYTTQLLAALREMTFEQFYARYMEAGPDGRPTPYAAGPIAVGHVAIVDVDAAGMRWIIEAMPPPKTKNAPYPAPGVDRIPYDLWLSHRKGQLVWQARLRGHSSSERAKIAEKATGFRGQPYGILNFDLSDFSNFYCSKLAWHVAKVVLQVAIDDNANPYRLLPLSPKQVLYSKRLTRLHEPGSYWSR